MPNIKNLENKAQIPISGQTWSHISDWKLETRAEIQTTRSQRYRFISGTQLAQPTNDALGEVAGRRLAAQIRRADSILAQDLVDGGSETVRKSRLVDMLQ